MRYWIFILLFFITACDDALFNAGDVITKNIEIEDFSEIYIEDIFDVYLIQDTVCKIEVRGGSNLIPNLEFKVDTSKKLTISDNNSAQWSRNYDKIDLYISVDTLLYLQLNEPSNVKCQNTIKTPNITILSIADYCEMDILLNCYNCYIGNSGTSGGIVNISGESNTLNIWARASLRVNADNFVCNYVTVKNESMADCRIHVNKELNVEILRDGNVFYKGNPETINFVNEKAKSKLIYIGD